MDPIRRKEHEDKPYRGERVEGGATVLEGVGDLPFARVVNDDKTVVILAHFKPSPEELAILNDGGVVELGIHAEPIPPVSVNAVPHGWADEPPEQDPA